MSGMVEILNVGEGDVKLSFDPENPAERIRAARIVKDMLRRGYALLVETKPRSNKYARCTEFLEDTCEYVIADLDPEVAAKADEKETKTQEPETRKRRPGRPRKKVDASKVGAVAVAKTAGG